MTGEEPIVTEHVVTAYGNGAIFPRIVATERNQRDMLVDLALRDPGFTGIGARTHVGAYFYVWDRPVGLDGNRAPRRFLQVGYFAKFGAALFYDDPRPPGDQEPTTEDWAWVALRPRPLADVPMVYFDQESGTQFPPAAVMPVDELRELVMEWCNTGQRPTSVQWLAVNDLRWKLTSTGEVAAPDQHLG